VLLSARYALKALIVCKDHHCQKYVQRVDTVEVDNLSVRPVQPVFSVKWEQSHLRFVQTVNIQVLANLSVRYVPMGHTALKDQSHQLNVKEVLTVVVEHMNASSVHRAISVKLEYQNRQFVP
jgi:hypothetical protein